MPACPNCRCSRIVKNGHIHNGKQRLKCHECGRQFVTGEAIAYTDFWDAYGAVLPRKRHRAVGKESGQTSYIERFNNTLRQPGAKVRMSRLVGNTLSFSKSLENHVGAIWYFIHNYNASLPV